MVAAIVLERNIGRNTRPGRYLPANREGGALTWASTSLDLAALLKARQMVDAYRDLRERLIALVQGDEVPPAPSWRARPCCRSIS